MRRPRPSLSVLVLLTAAVLVVSLMGGVSFLRETIESDLALEDYRLLKQHLAGAWANMEWIADHRGVDFRATDSRTTAALARVTSAREARDIFDEFVRSFRDPHLYTRPLRQSLMKRLVSGSESSSPPVVTAEMLGNKVCKALGFRSRDLGFNLRFSRQKGFRHLETEDGNPFEAGILPLPDGRHAGVLRIAHFGEDGYPDVCRAAWEEYRRGMQDACTDGWCSGFRTLIRDRLLGYVEDRIDAMERAGYDLLVVDITGNGGGTDWVNATARIVSPKKLSCNRFSMVRHPHWQAILEYNRQIVRKDSQREGLGEPVRERLRTAEHRLEEMIEQTKTPCDRMPMWEGRAPAEGCTNLVQGESYTCGLFPYLEPGDLDGVSGVGILFQPFENQYTEQVNKRPLAVLVDRDTASAAEDFGSILQDNGAAVLLGSETWGAGCGFVNGGIPLVLENVGLKVMAPDCIRYRRDGTNEIEGIHPDIPLDWNDDTWNERTRKVIAALMTSGSAW